MRYKASNQGDLDFDLSRSIKVKCDGTIGVPIHGFLLMFNSNIGPNWAPLRDISLVSLQNPSDLDFDLSRSLKVKSNGSVGLPIYDFLLVSNSNYMSNSHPLGVIAARKKFSYLLSLGPKFGPPPGPPLLWGDFSQN